MIDVIVVGAGPAGGIIAKILSEKGHSVLVIDKKKVVGKPVQCGEALSKFALKNTNLKANKEWIKLKFKGIKIFVPNGKYFLSLVKGYCIDRSKFDKWLIDQAIYKGCQILLNHRVIRIKRKGDLWYIKANEKVLNSKILVGADGYESNIAKWLGILKRRDFIYAIEYKFKGNYPENFLSIFMNSKFKYGYAWLFPREDECNIGIGGKGNLKKKLDKFCRSIGINPEERKSIISGVIPKDYQLSCFVKDAALIVGDAAGLTNPIFGGGIHAALFSGKIAAETIHRALNSGEMQILSDYNRILKRSPFCNPILRKAGEIFYSLSNEEWNFVGEVFENKNYSEVSYFEIFKKFLAHPKFFLKLRKFYILKKAIDLSQKLI